MKKIFKLTILSFIILTGSVAQAAPRRHQNQKPRQEYQVKQNKHKNHRNQRYSSRRNEKKYNRPNCNNNHGYHNNYNNHKPFYSQGGSYVKVEYRTYRKH